MSAFDRELAIERAEAGVAAALDAHGAATIAAARAGAPWPPWPDALRAPALARLTAPHDPAWAARARTLARWSLAARVGADPEVRASHRQPETLDGLAARYHALRVAAPRLGAADAHALLEELWGRCQLCQLSAADDAIEDGAPPAAPTVELRPVVEVTTEDGPPPPLPTVELPDWRAVAAHLAAHAGVDLAALTVHDDGAAAVTVATSAGATCVFPAVVDLTSLTVAAHELGHGVYATRWCGLPLGLAAAPSRAFDEAIGAWAVRALEAILPPAWEVVARWRRRRGERARARLAAMEHDALVTGDTHAAWRAHLGPWRPSLAAALFAEPGVAGAYAEADALALAPAPGAIAAWGAMGASLDVTALGGGAAGGPLA